MIKKVFCLLSVFLLAACASDESALELVNPFIGGIAGIDVEFQDFRKEVFDGGRDPFDVVVKLDNKGEADVAKNLVKIRLSGINPAEFSKLEEQLSKSPDDDILATKKDSTGKTIVSPPVFVEFNDLNHFSPIVGASADFILRADVCYAYKTMAVSKLCVRSNILSPETGGICEINEKKAVLNSGAPLQFGDFLESARAKDKIGFVFEIKKVGTGDVFEKESSCNRAQKNKADKVFVKVDTKLNGVSCTGLTSSGSVAEGFVTLFGGSKVISCTQPVSTKTNFEQLVSLEAGYDFENFAQTTFTVKSSGSSS
ncbi:hypothetical protein HY484_03040 [Candidatus Woesearchaeota archaeon]|nr:hypothetical protein [Candidatus Woesearchaeota archaeon]